MKIYDGGMGEGGGSILRLVTSLALITQEPVKIINIRKKRPRPGLQTQHLTGIRALAEFCGGDLEGDYLGSESISFTPSTNWKSSLKIKVTTAGSLGLILQSLQVAILGIRRHTLKLELQGGATFGKWAPSIPYIDHVTWEILRQMDFKLNLTIKRHGFYPKGGAHVLASMQSPSVIHGLNLEEFEKPKVATIQSFASHHLQRPRVAERQADTIKKALQKHNIDSNIICDSVNTSNPGSGVLIVSKSGDSIISGDFVGERELSAEKVGKNAFNRYIKSLNSRCTVDPFLADQILVFTALASTPSSFYTPYLSSHTKTNMKLIKDILGVKIHTKNLGDRFKILIDI